MRASRNTKANGDLRHDERVGASSISRRALLGAVCAALPASQLAFAIEPPKRPVGPPSQATLVRPGGPVGPPSQATLVRPGGPICAFIKFVQALPYDELADRIAEMGFDG
ncbi:MAG: hypothetical protein KDB14_31295, partial [Planctomycetales bacterium]|nr:hypothetical protein [Planctomycetales bacterium]